MSQKLNLKSREYKIKLRQNQEKRNGGNNKLR